MDNNIAFMLNSLYEATAYGPSRYERLSPQHRQQLKQILSEQQQQLEKADKISNERLEFFQNEYQPKHPQLYKFDPYYM
jgi:uncharacterized membrane protein